MKAHYNTPEIKISSQRLSWVHVVLVVLAFLLWRSCQNNSELSAQLTDYKVLQDKIKYFENENGELVATKLALEGDKSTLKRLLDSQKDSTEQLKKLANNYRRIAAAARIETVTQIDTIEVPFVVDAPPFDVPFEKNDQWYSLSGRSTNNGLTINNITIPNQQSIVIGDRKEGFFKTEFRIDVVNSNPLITTTEIDGYNYQQKKKRFGFGVFAGYGISNTGLSPQIGVGVSYNLIRF